MPKAICSPSRPTECSKRHSSRPTKRGRASSLFEANTKHASSAEIDDEPTSPKVTCAGRIKVRHKARPRRGSSGGGGRNWLEVLGLKKDIVHFLGALRFGARCFGSFHGAVDCTSDEDDEEEEKREVETGVSRSVFSNWVNIGFRNEEEEKEEEVEEDEEEEKVVAAASSSSAPPPNALLLMRSRSTPATRWSQRGGGGDGSEGDEVTEKRIKEEEESLVLMSYAPDFFRMSSEIAKETWLVGGSMDPLARSRSWKR